MGCCLANKAAKISPAIPGLAVVASLIEVHCQVAM